MPRKLIFDPALRLANKGGATEYQFVFRVFDTMLHKEIEEIKPNQPRHIKVSTDNALKKIWKFTDEEMKRVAFAYACRYLLEEIPRAGLKDSGQIKLTRKNTPIMCPFNPNNLDVSDGAILEIPNDSIEFVGERSTSTFSVESLQWILAGHRVWLASAGRDGKQAVLRHANLSEALLPKANLRRAELQWANLEGANLKGADLRGANLRKACLQSANLRGADLRGAMLQNTDLRRANLRGADLTSAKVSGAALAEADLRGADIEGWVDATFEQFMEAIVDTDETFGAELSLPLDVDDLDDALVSPEVPIPPPAPITTKIVDDRLVLDELAEVQSDSIKEDLELNWSELRRDTESLRPRLGNAPGLIHRLEDYSDALGKEAGKFNEILLGLRGEALVHALTRAEPELLGDTLGEVEGLVAKHQIFIRHFPRWLRHIAAGESEHITSDVVERAKPVLDKILSEMTGDQEFIDPRVPETLTSIEGIAFERTGIARAVWLGVYRGLNNALHTVAQFGIEFAKRTRDEALKQGSKRAAVFLVSLGGVGLMELIGVLPTEFAWLAPILVFLRRATRDHDETNDDDGEPEDSPPPSVQK